MNIFRSRFLMVAGLAGAAGLLVNVNCGGGGGGSGTGGTTGTGGTSATGGKNGTGGSGTGGSGGKSTGGNGGAATGGNGGAATGGNGGAATGGSGGAATGGSGGSSTTDGGSGTAPFSFTFDKNTEGFNFNNFNSSGGNLFDVDGGTKPTLTWDNTVGSPGSTPTGSLKLDVTFTDFNQFVLISSGTKPLINSSSKSAQVMVMLEAVDGGHAFGGGVQLEANSGASFTGSASGTYTTLTPGTWTKVPLDLTSGTLDRTQIVQFSINVTTGSMPDGGTFAGPVHAVLHIDTLDDGSGNPGPVPPNATFDATTQGFTVSAATHPDGGATPAVTFDSATGNPNPGSIEVTLPFNAFNQQYSIQSDVAPAADLSGKTIHAKVMLDKVDGGPASVPSNYVQLFVQSSGFKFANGPGGNLTAGTWTDLTLTVSSPSFMVSGYDPTQIIQVGVQVGIGSMPDGGTFGAEISPHIHIDSIVAQ